MRRFFLILSLLLLPAFVLAYDLFESYTDYDTFGGTRDVNYEAQTFTPSTTHTIKELVLLQCRTGGTADMVFAGIYATDLAGYPTGSALVLDNTSFELNDLSACNVLQNQTYSFATGTELTAGNTYALVWGCTGCPAGNRPESAMDTTAPTYAGGTRFYTGDAGVNWTEDNTIDFYFGEYGETGGSATSTATSTFGVWLDEYGADLRGFLAIIVLIALVKFVIVMSRAFFLSWQKNKI